MMWKRNKNSSFGTVSVGGAKIPTDSEISDAKNDIKEKTKTLRQTVKEKPKSEKKSVLSPLKVKIVKNTIDDEYIELAKRYAGIKQTANPSLSDFAKVIIKLFDDNMKMYKTIETFKKKLNSSSNPVLSSTQSGRSWN